MALNVILVSQSVINYSCSFPSQKYNYHVFQRPSFCPIHNLHPDEVLQLPQAIRSRGIDVGAVTLLESCDGNVLLTRRASHLSIFPGVWVPPGGCCSYLWACRCVYVFFLIQLFSKRKVIVR